MAAFHHGVTTSLLRDTSLLNSRKSVLLVYCVSTSFPRNSTRRKNHLRQKILKNLKKPTFPNSEAEKYDNSEVANENTKYGEESRELEVSVSEGVVGLDKSAGTWAKESIFKYGLWLVGAFVFQIVCAVLFFSKNEVFNGNDDKSSVIELGGDVEGKSRVKVVLNGNGVDGRNGAFVYVDELEMEKKIEEIRALAREAREKERLESRKNFNGDQSSDNDGEKHSKSVIEEEVDDKLVKLRKKLEKSRESSLENSRKESKAKTRKKVSNGELDVGEANGALWFKKKYKYKGLDGDPIGKPKGFYTSHNVTVNGVVGSEGLIKGDEMLSIDNCDRIDVGDDEKQLESSANDLERKRPGNVVEEDKQKSIIEASESTKNSKKMVSKERGVRKQIKRKDIAKSKVINGTDMEELKETHGPESLKSKKLSVEAMKSGKTSTRDSEMTPDQMSRENDRSGDKTDVKSMVKPESEADMWWLNLPYVLAILMRRGQNGEDGEGLYTLKSSPSAEDHLPHIVAFEDRADANNFCYLLLSFFEDLEDFNAQVVPLTAEELKSAAKTYATSAIVVRKGQLQLYAGQPLSDAEMAVRRIINRG